MSRVQVSILNSNDWISSYLPFTTDLVSICAGPFLTQSSSGSVLLRVACYATQLLISQAGVSFASASRFEGFRVPQRPGDAAKSRKRGFQGKCHLVASLAAPGLSWAVLAPLAPRLVLELWAAPRAALGWPWLLPPPSPKSTPSNDTQNGQLHQKTPLHSEFSRQPGVHQRMRLT